MQYLINYLFERIRLIYERDCALINTRMNNYSMWSQCHEHEKKEYVILKASKCNKFSAERDETKMILTT